MAPVPEVYVLRSKLERAESEVDAALDRGDRKAFRVWTKRRAALATRLADLLTRMACA
jgi:hypothetical protein